MPQINHIDIICPEKSDDCVGKLKNVHFLSKRRRYQYRSGGVVSLSQQNEQQDKL